MRYANVKRFSLTRVPLILQKVDVTLFTLLHLKFGYSALRFAAMWELHFGEDDCGENQRESAY